MEKLNWSDMCERYGASTVRRLLKYCKQGYTACQGTFVTLLKQIADDPSRIQGEVEYVD